MPLRRGSDVTALLVLAQTLTNLVIVPAGSGLPSGWKLSRLQGVEPPSFEVTRGHTLRIIAVGQGGTATYRLHQPIPAPASSRQQGSLTWRWRAGTPLRAADLKRRDADDSPIRVVITFQDGRTIAYAWGNREGRGESFASWAGHNRMIVVLQRAEACRAARSVQRLSSLMESLAQSHRFGRRQQRFGWAEGASRLRNRRPDVACAVMQEFGYLVQASPAKFGLPRACARGQKTRPPFVNSSSIPDVRAHHLAHVAACRVH